MGPLEVKRKVKELEELGVSQRKIAEFSDISPSALNRFLNGSRSGMNIAAKVLIFIAGTEKLSEFKVNGVRGEIVAIKKYSAKGKTKIYQQNHISNKEKQILEEVNAETDKVIKTSKNIEEIPSELKDLSKKLSAKHNNKIQIPYWITCRLFEVYQTSSLHCSTPKQETIILQGTKELLKDVIDVIDKLNFKEKDSIEINYMMQAMNLEGIILKCEERAEDASNIFLKALRPGIDWFGTQKETNKMSYLIYKNLLEIALNNLNNALYSSKSRLITESKKMFLLLDKDFDKPGNPIGEAVVEKIVEVMREHKENNLPVSPGNFPFSCFFKKYAGFEDRVVERLNLKKEVVLA